MLTKLFYGVMFVMAFAVIFVSPSYCLGELGIQPPADWSGGPPFNSLTGDIRTISNVLPGAFGEDNEISAYGGTYSNQVLFNGNGTRYRVQIALSDPLTSTSGPSTIPVSNMQFLLTYVYMYYGKDDPNNGEGKASYKQAKYSDFSVPYATVYVSTPAESASKVQGQFQFKYAVLVPDNQTAGRYVGTINYQVVRDDNPLTVIKSGSADIRVDVGNYFRLSVDRGSADFETMKPGAVKDNVPPEGIIITSKTNMGNPWYLKISNDNPLSSGPYIIPESNLIWYGWTDGKGTWYGTGNNSMTLVPELMYASGATEGSNLPDGTNNHLKFKLTIPGGQPGGKYLSNIKLTMTE